MHVSGSALGHCFSGQHGFQDAMKDTLLHGVTPPPPCLRSNSRKRATLSQYKWQTWTFRKCLRTPSQRQKYMELDEVTSLWGCTARNLLVRALILRVQLLQARRPAHSLHCLLATHQHILRGIQWRTDVLFTTRSNSGYLHLHIYWGTTRELIIVCLCFSIPTHSDSIYYEEKENN